MNQKKQIYALLILLTLLAIAMLGSTNPSKSIIQSASALTITAQMDQASYRLRQNAKVTGNITLGGSPATNLVVVVEVNSPPIFGQKEFYSFRTLQFGNSSMPWLANVTSIYIQDVIGNPIDTIKAGSQMQISMNVYNTQSTTISVYATTTVYDSNMASLATNQWSSSIDPVSTVSSKFQMQIPSWACSGRAVIVGCVYSDEPANGGIAYSPESPFYYSISRTQTGLLGITQPSPPPPQNTPGTYTDPIRLSATPMPGTYSVYVLGQSTPAVKSSATTSFTVQTTNGIPPQASFAYSPPNPSINRIVSFDASSSTPEGYNDVITRYEWDFGDGTPHYITTGNPADPTASHTYTQAIRYIVTLNVTSNEGLWCTTSKPITIGLGYGPTANFTWIPPSPVINETVTFDASNSTPGDFSTLVNYMWNFSDGTGIFNVTTNQTSHSFTQPGNYTVTLTVTDSVNRTATTSAILPVQNATVKAYDVNHDGKIDGKDIALAAFAYGTISGDPRWNPNADVNHDGKIDGKDIALIARNYGTDP
jgi:PKD repeat protein